LPNHFHGIIIVNETVGASLVGARLNVEKRADTRPAPTTLGEIIGTFKSITTDEYINGPKQNDWTPFHENCGNE